jgi:hypothetical protein
MGRNRIVPRTRQSPEMHAAASWLQPQRATPAAYPTRTCTRCGHNTTFVLEDPVGWYVCIECGRYA